MQWKIIVALICELICMSALADTLIDPCTGDYAMLSMIDRPTASFTPCIAPQNKLIVESGYQYQQLPNKAYAHTLPLGEIRYGLPGKNEFVVLLPNYFHQSVAPHTAYSPMLLGVKHQLGYTNNSVYAIGGLVTLPSGDANLGSPGFGGVLNGIYSLNITSSLNFTIMGGVNTQTNPANTGGKRYYSINPDVVLTWGARDDLSLYIEFFGQSKTAANEGFGLDADTGIIYLVRKNLTVDVEYGQRITGNLIGFQNYIGTGIAVLF